MTETPEGLRSIGDIAAMYGLNPSAIRYYESIGVLDPITRQNGRRVFDDRTSEKIGFIVLSTRAGITLKDLKSILKQEQEDWRDILERNVRELRMRAESMEALADHLQSMSE